MQNISLSRKLLTITLGFMALVVLFMTSSTASADAPPPIEWIRQFGAVGPASDVAHAVDANGNVYVVGSTSGTPSGQSSAGSCDAFVRKYDSAGTELWTRQFGTSSFDQGLGVWWILPGCM